MNPRIHTPAWYKLIEIISEEEYDHAIDSESIVVPPFSQVTLPSLAIQCQENRWEVSTKFEEQAIRLGDIVAKVFDSHLKHTPVNSFGFNFHYSFELASDSSNLIILALRSTGLFEDASNMSTGLLSFTKRFDGYTERVEIKPATIGKPKLVDFAFNYHHQISSPVEDTAKIDTKFFEIGDIIKQHLLNHKEGSLSSANNFVQRLASINP